MRFGTGWLDYNECTALYYIQNTHRISRKLLQVNNMQNMKYKIIHVYSPPTDPEENEVEEFYLNIQIAI